MTAANSARAVSKKSRFLNLLSKLLSRPTRKTSTVTRKNVAGPGGIEPLTPGSLLVLKARCYRRCNTLSLLSYGPVLFP